MEGTLETIMFCDFVERGLTLPVSEFFYRLLQFWGIQLHHLSLEFFPISTFFNISSSLFLSPMPPILPLSVDVNWYSVLRPEASTWPMIQRVKEPSGRNSGFMSETLTLHFQKEFLVPSKSKRTGQVVDLVASKLSASLKPLQNGRIKESRDLLLCKPSGPASSTSETSCLQI